MKNSLFLILLVFIAITGCDFNDRAPDKNTLLNSGLSPENALKEVSFSKREISGKDHPDDTDQKISQKKKKKKKRNPGIKTVISRKHHPVDFSIFEKMKQLDGEIDINEPRNQDYLFNGSTELGDHPFTMLSREKYFRISFDNDILDNTDHFYTNGIRFDFINSSLSQLPLHFLMPPYKKSGMNYYGITLVQNMYTPSTTKSLTDMSGDRPYAAYLYFGYYKITNDGRKQFRRTSELDLGVIGPWSGGDLVQISFHNAVPTNNEPVGWENQVQNDVVLNYNIIMEKGLISLPAFDLNVTGTGMLGTLYTNVSGGFSMRTGSMNPYFSNLWVSPQRVNSALGVKNFQAYFFTKINGTIVGYDATLQGGMFNNTSPYTISAGNVSRFLFNGSAGLTMSLGGVRMDIEQFVISPEFHGGWWHKWVHIGLTFSL